MPIEPLLVSGRGYSTIRRVTREHLRSIEAPTLIIVGDSDIVTPEHAVEMFRSIPAAQLCVVPHSGHGVMPKETILTFLQEGATGET